MSSTHATLKCTPGSTSEPPDAKHSIEGLMERVVKELREGIRHGHFDFVITGAHARGEHVEVILKAGKNHRFLIPKGVTQQ